ncbi:MAG TPA: D-aminoacylase [Vicinamibacteria bacterium]|nr:D-aminoacylase [Vicinamibacteria bacterium]
MIAIHSKRSLVIVALGVVLSGSLGLGAQSSSSFDLVIADGRIVDGTGAPWFIADVGIIGGRITAIGRLAEANAAERIDARDLVVAPGFIDMLGQSEFSILVDGRAASKIMQGITTEVTGEGASIAPVNDRMVETRSASYQHFGIEQDFRTLAEYFHRIETRSRPAINIATFVGSGGVRDYVIGRDDRPATPDELEAMKKLVAEAMEDGALGVSSSLQYVPNRFATTDELVALARVAAEYGGIYITHQRSEANLIFESLDEVFTIAERARIPAEVWHLKTAYRANWGKMPQVLEKFEAARARGLDVTANQYPYDRASNDLDACLPIWVREGSADDMIARLRDPEMRERIKAEMADPNITEWENQWYGSGGAEGVMVSSVLDPALRRWEGMTLAEIGRQMGKDPRDALMDLIIADHGETSCIISIMREDDVRAALKHPLISIDTDSSARAEDGPLSESKSHPRAWGTFPRILGKYVREEKLLTLEEAIRKMTSRPATRVGLQDRGILRPGMAADVTVFDPETIRDVSTFEDPNHYSVGVRYVLVNGRPVVFDGKITDERPGQVLRGPGYRSP